MSASEDIGESSFSVKSPYGRRAVALSVAAAVGGFLFGFDSSVINGAVDSIQRDFALNDVVTGLVVAISLLGCAAGAVLAGNLSDRWGRLRVMFIGGIMFFVSSLGAAFAFGVWDLALWRVIGGLGIGTASVIAPTGAGRHGTRTAVFMRAERARNERSACHPPTA